MKKHVLEILVVLATLGGAAHAAGISVTGGWMRALPAGVPAGGYFTLHNDTAGTITLSGASSPACASLMLHRSMDMGGMAEMQMVASVPVAPGRTLTFSPGGYHLMCMNPALKPGTAVPVTLQFADGMKVTTSFAVRDARGQ